MKKTQDEINAEIATLRDYRARIPARNFFGESNTDQLDAQIVALEENLDASDVDDRRDAGDFDDREADGANEAIAWRDDGDAQPSNGWKPLVK